MNRRGFLGGVATALAAGAGCIGVQAAETTETERHDIGDESVTVANPAGDVVVRTEPRDDVRLEARKRDDFGNEDALSKLSVTTSRSNGVFAVDVTDETDSGMAQATSLDLHVTLPAGTRVTELDVEDEVDLRETVGGLTVDSEDGDVRLRDVEGAVTVEAGDGDVSLRDVTGSVTVEADDGDVSLRNVGGPATVEADDGNVRTHTVAGDLTATLEDGDATVRNTDGTVTVDAEDGNVTVSDPGAVGSVSLDDGDLDLAVPAVDEAATVSVGDGDLTLSLAADLDARLSVRTADGSIDPSGVEFVGGDDLTSVEHTFGAGSNSLSVSVEDGDVTLARL